jgi:hypothetical protein
MRRSECASKIVVPQADDTSTAFLKPALQRISLSSHFPNHPISQESRDPRNSRAPSIRVCHNHFSLPILLGHLCHCRAARQGELFEGDRAGEGGACEDYRGNRGARYVLEDTGGDADGKGSDGGGFEEYSGHFTDFASGGTGVKMGMLDRLHTICLLYLSICASVALRIFP